MSASLVSVVYLCPAAAAELVGARGLFRCSVLSVRRAARVLLARARCGLPPLAAVRCRVPRALLFACGRGSWVFAGPVPVPPAALSVLLPPAAVAWARALPPPRRPLPPAAPPLAGPPAGVPARGF